MLVESDVGDQHMNIFVNKKRITAEYWFNVVEETYPCESAKSGGEHLHMNVQVEKVHFT